MATGVVDIDQIPPDIDPMAVGVVKNPLKEDFVHAFSGKDLVIPAESEKQFPLPVAVHMVKHLAEKIIRAEFRKKIAAIKDTKTKELESSKPIPDYKGKIWEKMRELCQTDSDFFDDPKKDEKGESNKDKFIR